MKKKKNKICIVCGMELPKGKSKYCCKECCVKAYTKTECECIICGEDFIAKPGSIFCSKECEIDSKRNDSEYRTRATCAICNSKFTKSGLQLKKKYCSDKCAAEAAKKRANGEIVVKKNPHKKPLPNKKCEVCGEDFTPRRKDHVICSPKCKEVRRYQKEKEKKLLEKERNKCID